MAQQENILGTEKIGKLLAKFAIPGIISMVVNSLYNIVDQIFIGNGVGYLGNGATTVIFPMTTFAMAFAMLFGDGAASYMSLMLGQKDEERAGRGTMAGIVGTVIGGFIIGICYLLFMKPLCLLFGASQDILPYAMDYGYIIAIGIPASAICCGGASIIRADGNPKFNMIGLFTGTAINVICDPIFIFLFHWGVKGAAFATILGQMANAVLNIIYVAKMMKSVQLRADMVKSSFRDMGKVAALGVSSFITQMAMVIAMATRNNILVTYGAQSKYGDSIPVTTLGITMKVFSILMSIVIGLATGAQPIFGYNYGAKKYDRVKKTFWAVAIIATAVMFVAFIVAQNWPMAVIGIFGNNNGDLYNEFAVKCMKIYLLLIPTAGLQIMSGIFFQALGYPKQASILSLSKQLLFQVPATIILPIFLGVEGVLWAGPFADATSLILTCSLLIIYWKRMFAPNEEKTVKISSD